MIGTGDRSTISTCDRWLGCDFCFVSMCQHIFWGTRVLILGVQLCSRVVGILICIIGSTYFLVFGTDIQWYVLQLTHKMHNYSLISPFIHLVLKSYIRTQIGNLWWAHLFFYVHLKCDAKLSMVWCVLFRVV